MEDLLAKGKNGGRGDVLVDHRLHVQKVERENRKQSPKAKSGEKTGYVQHPFKSKVEGKIEQREIHWSIEIKKGT